MNPSDSAPALATRDLYYSNRLLRTITVVLLLVICVLAGLIGYMVPLKDKELAVIALERTGEDVVFVHRAGQDITANTLLHIAYLRKYIEARFTIDKQTEKERYQMVKAMSSAPVFQTFRAQMENPKSVLFQKGLRQSVHILRHEAIQPGIVQIEFETTMKKDESMKEFKTIRVATLSYTFEAQKVTQALSLVNPIGLIISDYSDSKREN